MKVQYAQYVASCSFEKRILRITPQNWDVVLFATDMTAKIYIEESFTMIYVFVRVYVKLYDDICFKANLYAI